MGIFIRSCAITLALAGFAGTVCAQEALVDFSGTYRASARETRVEVSTWGEHCGPRPQNATEPAGANVDVRTQGTHLALAFPDRNLRTDACWSPNPMVRITSAVATTTRWRTECVTPQGDAKRERGVYTINAPTRDALELVDESNYDWQLNQSHCVAKVRITQRLQRTPTSTSAPEAEPEDSPAGCTPGALARLRLRPQETRIAPGERICFAVRAVDAVGCAVTLPPGALKWTLLKPEAVGGALSGNCFKAANTAAEGEGRFRVVVTAGALREEAIVSVVPADLSDITARRGAGTSAAELANERAGGITSELGIDAVVRSSSEGLLIAALLAMMLGLVGFAWFLFARARQRAAPPVKAAGSSGRPSAAAARPSAQAPRAGELSSSAGPTEQLICPSCRRGYSGGTASCPRDGTPLIAYAEFLRRAQAVQQVASTCPACGAQLAPGAVFCGDCGKKVVS